LNMLRKAIIAADENLFEEIQLALADRNEELFLLDWQKDLVEQLKNIRPRVIFLEGNRHLPPVSSVLKRIKEYDPLLEVIVVGEIAPPARVAEIIRDGAFDYLARPLTAEALRESLARLEEKIALRRETFELEKELASKYVFEGMVSRNARMLEIFSLIERLAKHQITVLITGETGTGKELAARAIHRLSPRRQKPFVVVDCTALPESLFESEVFGYEKGAFTGADHPKPGLLQEADGGTVFFDEISEMPAAGQAKLLRFLSEGTFRRLGSNKTLRVDVRIICATNRDLREEVRAGRFREDLFHRINVAEISLPPLRKRKEDIPLLCLHFLQIYSQKFQKDVRGVSNRVKKVFAEYDWPGNVRELEKVIERGVMLTNESFIDLSHLPENLIKQAEARAVEDRPYPYLDLTLAEIEKKHLLEVLKAVGFNKQKAAQKLGITRPALYRKLKKFGLA